MSEENVARLSRLILEGFGNGDLSVIDEVVAEHFIEHQAEGPPQGRQGLNNLILMLRQAFPDLTYSVVQMADNGDKVWAHFRSTGTHKGTFMGHAPTGKRIEIDVIDIARFKDGKIVEHWGVADRLKLLQQLELIPARPAPETPAT